MNPKSHTFEIKIAEVMALVWIEGLKAGWIKEGDKLTRCGIDLENPDHPMKMTIEREIK